MEQEENILWKNVLNVYENARKQIRYSCDLFDECRLDNNVYEVISKPRRIIEVNIPVRMDNGQIKTFTGFRSQHNDARWPNKWWIRFHQDVTKDEVMALSMWMTFKCAVLDLPLWGWKWWIIVNPKELSDWELERLSRWYVREIHKYIWPDQDVPAPDVNTSPKIMAWMMDEYSMLNWVYSPWSFTWKPLSSGWSLWRWEATAQWWIYALKEYLSLNKDTLKWKTIILEWAWNAWLTMAKLATEEWAKIIWISDSKWGIFNNKWLDIKKIIEIKKSKKSVIEYKNWTWENNNDLILKSCDILIPAALENRITKNNANNIQAKLILELANWPTTPDADDILYQKWIPVIPDILANAGWVTVSYFEQVQNNTNFYWSEDEIQEKLMSKMNSSTKTVVETSKEYSTHLRAAAYIVAIRRVIQAMIDRWQV